MITRSPDEANRLNGSIVRSNLFPGSLEGSDHGKLKWERGSGDALGLEGRYGLSVNAVRNGLDHRSGLLGLSNRWSQVTRRLAEATEVGDAPSQLALDIFCLPAAQTIAAAATSLKGLVAVIFTRRNRLRSPTDPRSHLPTTTYPRGPKSGLPRRRTRTHPQP